MLRWIWRSLAWLVILAAVAVISLAVLVPRLGGATPYNVLTGSMAPGLPPGTLLVVRPVDAENIGVGDVITYQVESGQATLVTHRVVTQAFDAKGQPIFRTQGDANDVPDARWVRPVQIRGELWYAVPYLGHVSNLLTAEQRQMEVYALVGLLFAYSLFLFAGALADRRRQRPAVARPRRRVVEVGGAHA